MQQLHANTGLPVTMSAHLLRKQLSTSSATRQQLLLLGRRPLLAESMQPQPTLDQMLPCRRLGSCV